MKTNHWSQIRKLARETRHRMLKANGGDSSPDALLMAIANETGIFAYGLPAKDPLLYRAQAILHNNLVFFDNSLEEWQTLFNRMHEYAHHFLKHGSAILCGKDGFDAEASEDAIALGEQRVEGYGPHERRELEANLFAREFFLPCDELRNGFLAGKSAETLEAEYKMPAGIIVHQLMRGVLGIETEIFLENDDDSVNSQSEELDDNKDQQKAAFFGFEEFKKGYFELPVLVDAGPGTGKTRTLTARIEHLIKERGIQPENILALTYSNKAAEEMYSRVNVATNQNSSKIWMGTFHRFCLELIRKYSNLLDISAKPQVADTYDVQLLLEQSLDRLKLKYYRSLSRPSANFKRILDSISRAKDELVSPHEYKALAQTDLENAQNNQKKLDRALKDLEIAEAYRVYQEVLSENDLLDYGDLLFMAVDLLRKNDTVREEIQQKYRYILIDEYQDVNTASRELLKLVAGDGNGLWVVGDIRQAIYRFRGAAPTNMLLLTKEDYPNAEVLPLTTNYRARKKIVDTFTACGERMKAKVEVSRAASWNVFRQDEEGEVNFLEANDEHDEAHEIVETVKYLNDERKINYRDQAILCRGHADLVHYSAALEEAGIPVLYLGDFFERPEIRDLLCVIDLASGMDGRAIYRLAGFAEYNLPFYEAGVLVEQSLKENRRFPSALKSAAKIKSLSESAQSGFALMTGHLSDYHKNSSAWTVLSQYLFSRSNYLRNLVKNDTPQTMQRRLAIYQLLLLAYQLREKFTDDGGDQKKQFLNYIRQLKRNNDDKTIRQTPHWADTVDAVKMLTIHAAKGLEFKVVHLPGLSDGKFFAKVSSGSRVTLPSGMIKPEMNGWAAEEEECLFFVAISRAGDVLNIYRANQYKEVQVEPSNLLELIKSVLPVPKAARGKAKIAQTPKKRLVARTPITEFHEKVLQDYLDCPLKYLYRHEIKIPYFFTESAINKARLCVSKVWNAVNRQVELGLSIDQKFIKSTFEEVWEKYGPTEHPYSPDYRLEALRMINWTLKINPSNVDALTKPLWKVEIGNATVMIHPDYTRTETNGSRTSLIVEKLNFGESPREQIKDLIYSLYEEAALQNRSDSNVRTEIKASFMTNERTLSVPISAPAKEEGIKIYREAMDGINSGDFNARPNKDCCYCPYYFICQAKQV